MSHPEQLGFFRALAESNRDLIADARVLEIGSYDVNGSIREIFGGARDFTGVDLVQGPGVDRVGFGHQIDDPDASYDVVISAECFEHDPYWRQTLENMARLTAPGGLLAFSCASRGRPEHGTRRTSVDLSPGTQSEGLDHYRNVAAHELPVEKFDAWCRDWRAWYLPTSFDLYFCGIRRGGQGGVLPTDTEIHRLRSLMPWTHQLARLPLRALLKTGVGEERYQDLIHPYWQFLLRLGGSKAIRQPRR